MRKIATPISAVPLVTSLKAFLAMLLAVAVIMIGIPVMQGSGVAYAADFTGGLACVRALDSSTVWACGEGIALSTDGGNNYTEVPTGFETTFWDMAVIDASHVIAVSGSGGAIETLDGGATWNIVTSSTPPLYGIDNIGGTAYMVGSAGAIYSYDGTNATRLAEGLTALDLTGVCALEDGSVWAVGGVFATEAAVLHFTPAGGWTVMDTGISHALVEVDFSPDGQFGCAVGDSRSFYYTADGGETWNAAEYVPAEVTDATWGFWVTHLEGQTFYATASAGSGGPSWIIRSTDGGANWTLVETVADDWIFSIDALRNESDPEIVDIWAVGADTYHYTDTLPLPPVPFDRDLACVRMLDSNTVWACGEGIVRYNFIDNKWDDMALDYSTINFMDMAVIDANHVIAVSGSGGALETLDGGATWNVIEGITAPLYGIDHADGIAYLVGSGGIVYGYDGTTCNLMPQSLTTNDLAGVCALSGSSIWAVGGYFELEGSILSYDGTAWTSRTSGVETALLEVDFTDPEHGCAVGMDNTIVYTSDSGDTWAQATTPDFLEAVEGWAMWVAALEGQTFYAVASTGMGGTSWIMRSTDGGANWDLLQTVTGEWLFSLDALRNESDPDTVDIWAVGLAGATHHFTDTLPLPPAPFTGDLACVRMLDSDTVWACGVGIVRSENGGPWENMAPDYSTVTFWDLALLSESHVIAVSGNGGAIETLDGGATWTPLLPPVTAALYGIDNIGATTYMVGGAGTIYSYDGVNFTPMAAGLTTNDLASVCVLDDGNIWAVGGYYLVEGTILHSPDGGATWTAQNSPANTALMEVDFTDADHGCAVGFDNTIVYTADGGDTWTTAEIPTFLDPASSVMWVAALEGQTFYAVASTGLNGDSWIMRSTDGGANWDLLQTVTGEWLFSLDVLRNSVNPDTVDIWAVGLQAATHHFTDTLPLPSISAISPTSGVAGDTVTITGLNLGTEQGSSQVFFSGVPASSYLSWSGTEVSCVVPAGLSNVVQVSVQVNGMSSNSLDFAVMPVLNNVTPLISFTNGVVTLSGSSFGESIGSSVVTFNGVPAAQYTTWSDGTISCRVPSGAQWLVRVAVTTAGGSSSNYYILVIPFRIR